MNLEVIKERNEKLLQKMILLYHIEFTLEQLVFFFKNVYLLDEVDHGRMRLMGTFNEDAYNLFKETGIFLDLDRTESSPGKKPRLVQLYSVRKKQYARMVEFMEEKQFFINQMELFIGLIFELKYVHRMITFESTMQSHTDNTMFSYQPIIDFVEKAKIYDPYTGRVIE
jgi:hypothetical protein